VWRATALTLFPEMFPGPLGESLAGKALKDGTWALEAIDIRRFAKDRHGTVDDAPFGGGAGMVMKPDVLSDAIAAVAPRSEMGEVPKLLMSPRGAPFSQARARELAKGPGVLLVCGRFEGVDERVIEAHALEEVSVGDFVLSGGEIAAMALMDAVVRQLPGAVGDSASVIEESFADGLLDCPQYTRPEKWPQNERGATVPEVLLSGHHENIRRWRLKQALGRTWLRRPELLEVRSLSNEERLLLEEFRQESGAKS